MDKKNINKYQSKARGSNVKHDMYYLQNGFTIKDFILHILRAGNKSIEARVRLSYYIILKSNVG